MLPSILQPSDLILSHASRSNTKKKNKLNTCTDLETNGIYIELNCNF